MKINKIVINTIISMLSIIAITYILVEGVGYFDKWKIEELNSFPQANEIREELKGKISTCRQSVWTRAYYKISLDNGQKFGIPAYTYNDLYSRKFNKMAKMIAIGDSIYKQLNSDTIYIYKNNREFFFVPGKSISKD